MHVKINEARPGNLWICFDIDIATWLLNFLIGFVSMNLNLDIDVSKCSKGTCI
jgi:hypothetical protein